jgi:hypothetical protein
MGSKTDTRMKRGELLKGIAYTAILLWMNAYICREWFTTPTAYMNSMHGFWTALARMGDGGWWHARWWPYWDAGIPFEFAYSPLVPLLTAAWSAVAGFRTPQRFSAYPVWSTSCFLPRFSSWHGC